LRFKHNTIAIAYDFDGTLTPLPMQEYTVLPEIPIKPHKFWSLVKEESIKTGGEEIITYMRLMIEKAHENRVAVTPQLLKDLAAQIKFYPGVETYFDRINRYVKTTYGRSISIRHYIISSGLVEIISHTSIAKKFHNIFASQYHFDEYGHATFPNIVVNDTLKTQFIFRINKGVENLNESINTHMSESDRAIPFQNILYIGDGLTDVPCMTVTRKNGGSAVAVYRSYSKKFKSISKGLLASKRVDFIAKADFRRNSELDKIIKFVIDTMVVGIKYGRLAFNQRKQFCSGG
jgi:hypothetical protein